MNLITDLILPAVWLYIVLTFMAFMHLAFLHLAFMHMAFMYELFGVVGWVFYLFRQLTKFKGFCFWSGRWIWPRGRVSNLRWHHDSIDRGWANYFTNFCTNYCPNYCSRQYSRFAGQHHQHLGKPGDPSGASRNYCYGRFAVFHG